MADFWPAFCTRQNSKISKDSRVSQILLFIFIGGSN